MKKIVFFKIIIFIIVLSFFLFFIRKKVYENYDGPKIYYDNDLQKYSESKNFFVHVDKEAQKLYQDIYLPIANDDDDRDEDEDDQVILEKNAKINEIYKKVYVVSDIFTKEECNWIIYESEVYGQQNGWTTKRHQNYPTIDNPVEKIIPIRNYVLNTVTQDILPLFEKCYGVQSKFVGINDVFIVKYSVEKGMKELNYHADQSDFSFILTLNDDFTGGGTHFLNGDKLIKPKVGECAIFCGKNRHSGVRIDSGVRYIIAGFLCLVDTNYVDLRHRSQN